MQLFSSLLLATLLLTPVLAAPARPQSKGTSFKVDRVRRSNHVRNGAVALKQAYRKYGWKLPGNVTHATTAAGGETGNVPATPQEADAEFLSPVSIGGQTLMLDFDTGSSDLWVFDTQLPASQRQNHRLYDPSKSSTFKRINGATWSISYGDGSGARGNVGTDTVDIGGATVTNQAIELATAVAAQFVRDVHSDGLVGLAFSQLNTVKPTQQKTFFDNIMPDLALPVFTADLRHATAGSYEFGIIDSSKFSGRLTYISVDNSRGFWQVPSTRFTLSGREQQNPSASPAIADTGTSLMIVDDAVATAYWGQIQGAQIDPNSGEYVFPCDETLPDFGVGIGDTYTAVIPGALINYAPVQDANGAPTGNCYGGIQSNGGQSLQIYGDVMFKAQFVVFDGGNNRLGFAPHN